jgi:hypothetical protein
MLEGDRHILRTMIHATMDLPAISQDVRITASYEATEDRGSLRVLQKTAQLPLKMMLRACPPESASTFTATIKCSESLVALNQLFPGKSTRVVFAVDLRDLRRSMLIKIAIVPI